jgi:hypothetical protein
MADDENREAAPCCGGRRKNGIILHNPDCLLNGKPEEDVSEGRSRTQSLINLRTSQYETLPMRRPDLLSQDD